MRTGKQTQAEHGHGIHALLSTGKHAHMCKIEKGKRGGQVLTVWGDRTEHSAALAPGEEEEDQPGPALVLVGAQLHAAGPSWLGADPADGRAVAGFSSGRRPAPLHGSSHTSTPP